MRETKRRRETGGRNINSGGETELDASASTGDPQWSLCDAPSKSKRRRISAVSGLYPAKRSPFPQLCSVLVVASLSKTLSQSSTGNLDVNSPQFQNPSSSRSFVDTPWIHQRRYAAGNGFHIIGAHTDSACLRLNPVSKIPKGGYLEVGVQTYGGGLWFKWFDRNLTVAGRLYALRTTIGGRNGQAKQTISYMASFECCLSETLLLLNH